MRSFQLTFWIIFLLIYALFTVGSMQGFATLLSSVKKCMFRKLFISFSVLVISTMIFLYVWPGDVRTSDKYALYIIFNSILFIDFIFKIPLTLLFFISLFAKKKKTKQTLNWIGTIISGIVSLVMLYGMIWGKNDMVVNRVELGYSNLPKSFDEYRVIQFSDTHLGSFMGSQKLLKKAVEKVQKEDADLILFTGDLVNNFSNEVLGWDKIFTTLTKDVKSYSILGNHDYGNYSRWDDEESKEENFQNLLLAHENFGFRLLRNENIKLRSGTDSIYLAGVENWGHPPFPQYANLEQALSGIPENTFTILMTHDPAHWESLVDGKEKIELSLSGHSHGLQWGLKPAGIPFSLSFRVRKNWGGLYGQPGNYLYVNTGFGTVGIPWRIDMPAEITVISLKRIEVD